MPCREGQAIAIPQLKTPLPGTKACLIFIQRPQNEVLELNTAILLKTLHGVQSNDGDQSIGGAISKCAPRKEVKLLPIDLTLLAECFLSHMPAHGLAIAPARALDPDNRVNKFNQAHLGFVSPTGNVIVEWFNVKVRHPDVPEIFSHKRLISG